MLTWTRRSVPPALAALGVTCMIVGWQAGSSAAAGNGHTTKNTRAASCPSGGESSIRHAHSSSAKVGALAPEGTLWTTICQGNGDRILKGGPLDAALNSAHTAPPNQICTLNYVSPILIILRYRGSTRRFVVLLGGCPSVSLRDGTDIDLTPAGIRQMRADQPKSPR